MPLLVTTRYNNNTWKECADYRNKSGIACIYGFPTLLTSTIHCNSVLFIIEMNNTLNNIEGIGLIRNAVISDKYYNIYSDGNYNRYIYKSDYHITRDKLCEYNPAAIAELERLLFKGKTHLKRGAGVTTITEKMLRLTEMDMPEIIREIFLRHFNR